MTSLLSLEFWFSPRPAFMSGAYALGLLAVFALFVAGGVFARYEGRKLKKVDRFHGIFWKRFGRALIWMGALGMLITFFVYEGAIFLGMRMWYLVWMLGALAWAGSLLWFRYKKIPELLAVHHEAALRNT